MALAGQVALVTGAGRGIGWDVARGLLASGGERVHCVSRTIASLPGQLTNSAHSATSQRRRVTSHDPKQSTRLLRKSKSGSAR